MTVKKHVLKHKKASVSITIKGLFRVDKILKLSFFEVISIAL